MSESQNDWGYVLAFSAAILSLAVALPVFGRLVGGRTAARVSAVPAAGAGVGSLANILEDGLQLGWAFFGFVAGSALLVFGLLAFTAVVVLGGQGRRRLLALIPAGTMVGIVFYVAVGGPLMLATWLAAAAFALTAPVATDR
jgi:hypothetical protein